MLARAAISWFQAEVIDCSTERRWVSMLIRSVLLRSIDWRMREEVRPPLNSGTVTTPETVTSRV